MKRTLALLTLAVAAWAAPAFAQNSPLQLPPTLEKSLAARASDVTEVTLGKNMLDFASKFMGKDKNDAATRDLIQGLDGIYVRSYKFDKEGQYSLEEVEQIRRSFSGPEWTPMVHTVERKTGETTYVLIKQVNGQPHGMFVFSAEPKELTIVLILGPIKLSDLNKLSGLSGLSSLGDVQSSSKGEKGPKGSKGGKDGDE